MNTASVNIGLKIRVNENYSIEINVLLQIQLSELTSEKHKIQEHLRTSLEQHQRILSTYQQKVATLQEECNAAKVFQANLVRLPLNNSSANSSIA